MSTAAHQIPLRVLPESGLMNSPKFHSNSANMNDTSHYGNKKLFKTVSPIASSFTSSSTSSSTSDFTDLKGELLADLWQTSSNDSTASAYSAVLNGTNSMSVQLQQQQQNYYQNYSTINSNNNYPYAAAPGANWNGQNQAMTSSPPAAAIHAHQMMQQQPEHHHQQQYYGSQSTMMGGNVYMQQHQQPPPHLAPQQQPVMSNSYSEFSNNSNAINTANGMNVYPALTEENLMFNAEVDPLDTSARSANRSVSSTSQTYTPYQAGFDETTQEEVFNFEEQQQLQQSSQKHSHRGNFHHNHKSGSTSSASSTSSSVEANSPNSYAYQAKAQQQTQQNQQASVNTQLYKTELCASFMKMGICPYGNKCQFAHGENELKSIERPPKWRSKPCANWSKFGSCRYGNRCCFKHGV